MTIEAPLISVIIPNYNYANFLGEAIESVLKQTYQNFEIFVVDNESSDDSIIVASKYEEFITIVRKQHGGVSSARNLGFSLAKGSYICFLDSDDTWVEDKLEQQMKVALSSQAEIVYSGINLCDENLKVEGVLIPEYRGDCYSYYLKNPTKAIVLLGCSNALIKSSEIERIGGFREYLHHSADWDFFRRLCLESKVDWVSTPQINYRRHQKSMSNESLSNFYIDNEIAIRDFMSDINLNYGKIEACLKGQNLWFRYSYFSLKAFLKACELRGAGRSLSRYFMYLRS